MFPREVRRPSDSLGLKNLVCDLTLHGIIPALQQKDMCIDFLKNMFLECKS